FRRRLVMSEAIPFVQPNVPTSTEMDRASAEVHRALEGVAALIPRRLQFIDAFRTVADQLAALTAALRFTMEARKPRVVDAAFRTYDIGRALAQDETDAAL